MPIVASSEVQFFRAPRQEPCSCELFCECGGVPAACKLTCYAAFPLSTRFLKRNFGLFLLPVIGEHAEPTLHALPCVCGKSTENPPKNNHVEFAQPL